VYQAAAPAKRHLALFKGAARIVGKLNAMSKSMSKGMTTGKRLHDRLDDPSFALKHDPSLDGRPVC
jgi:hypothetical protein